MIDRSLKECRVHSLERLDVYAARLRGLTSSDLDTWLW
jgi:hypothetical protein